MRRMLGDDEVYDVRGILDLLREIYTNHGWPDGDFKKEECAVAIETFVTSLHQWLPSIYSSNLSYRITN